MVTQANDELSTQALIVDSATRIFADTCDHDLVEAAQDGVWASDLWATLEANGLLQLGLPESGTGLSELYEFLRVAGRFAVPLPLFERLLAQVALGRDAPGVGLAEVQNGTVLITWPEQHEQVLALDGVSGTARLLPLAGLEPQQQTTQQQTTMKGEPVARYDIGKYLTATGGTETAETELKVPALYSLAALGRAAQMCGGLEASLELAINYCSEREQFGRTISKFQAIQHQLAVLAAEVAAAQRATDAAIHSVAHVDDTSADPGVRVSDVAVAKVRVGAAVGVGAEIAHQVHGAMGFTMEYRLHQFTRRLWSWRDEYGTETDWAALLGDEVCSAPADELWSYIASHG